MSTTYSVITGDTFESIARKQYGTENESDRITRANPGVADPLTAGIELIVPVLPSAPKDRQFQAPAADPDEAAILIDGTRFRFWGNVRITRAADAMDTVEFSAPFEADVSGFRKTFRPFSFKPVVITVGGIPLFTGTMIGVSPTIENNQKVIFVSGYSLPGVLNDCTSPASAFPLEFNGQSLREIATTLAAPFGLSVIFQAGPGAIFERVATEPGERVLTFLTELAKQRNLIIASTSEGALIFWQSVKAGAPVARLQEGSAPVLSVMPSFSPQEYYSHITGVEPVAVGSEGSKFTVKNTRLEGVLRPITFNTPDTSDADVKAAVEAKSGRMFGNMASYSIHLSTWRDPKGELWMPNTTVTLLAPDAMIYSEYEFVIRSVEFDSGNKAKTATLNLVLPGSFSGRVPEILPWDV